MIGNKKRMIKIPDFKWSDLANLGRHKTMQFTMLVPVFGYMILFNDWIVENFKIYGEFPSAKVYLLYYGLTFLAMASLLYVVFCPKIIKQYGSPSEYVEHELKFMNHSKLERVVKQVREMFLTVDNKAEYSAVLQSLSEEDDVESGRINYILKNVRRMQEDSVKEVNISLVPIFYPSKQDLMYSHYKLLDRSKEEIRRMLLIFYFIGFCLLAIPSIGMFVEVLIKTVHSMLSV